MYKNQKEIRLFPKLPHSSSFHGLERFQERLLIFKFSSAEFYEPASFPWEIMACASSLLFFILCVEGGFYSTHYVPLFLVADLRLEAASTCLGPTFGKGKEGNLWSLLANASTTQLSLGLLTFTKIHHHDNFGSVGKIDLSFRLLFKIEVKVVQKCAVVYFRTMHWGTFKEQRKGGEIVVRVTTHISADN